MKLSTALLLAMLSIDTEALDLRGQESRRRGTFNNRQLSEKSSSSKSKSSSSSSSGTGSSNRSSSSTSGDYSSYSCIDLDDCDSEIEIIPTGWLLCTDPVGIICGGSRSSGSGSGSSSSSRSGSASSKSSSSKSTSSNKSNKGAGRERRTLRRRHS